MPSLLYTNDGEEINIPLRNGEFYIGRIEDNDLSIQNDIGVSRKHCVITCNPSTLSFHIKDLGSSNGTYVNDNTLGKDGTPLREGDRIVVGHAKFMFRADEQLLETGTESIAVSEFRQEDNQNLSSEDTLLLKRSDLNKKDTPEKYDITAVPPGTQVGAYEVMRPLEVSEFSALYLVFQPSVKRTVVMRMYPVEHLPDNGIETFKETVQKSGRIKHPNILPYFDAGSDDNFCFTTMPYMANASLNEKIRNGTFDKKKSRPLVKKIASALKTAYEEQGILHMDIRAENILFSDTHEPLLKELGLPQWYAGNLQMNRRSFLGSTHYMSPEQALDSDFDWYSDQYSLGIVFYFCLFGCLPFDADQPFQIIRKHQKEKMRFPKNSMVPDGILKTISKMTAKQPEKRFSSWDELLRALDARKKSAGNRVPVLKRPGLR